MCVCVFMYVYIYIYIYIRLPRAPPPHARGTPRQPQALPRLHLQRLSPGG